MTHSPDQVTYTKLGTNRGKPRIWIEGAKLSVAGFTRHASYSVCDHADGVLVLKLDDNGLRRVAGRTRNEKDIPIIDLTMPWLAEKYPENVKLRAVFEAGKITISIHHEDAKKSEREQRLKTNIKNGTVAEATLCAGAGVSTLALHQAAESVGIKSSVKWVVDMELKYLQVAGQNNYAITDDTVFIVGKAEEVERQFFTPVDVLHVTMDCAGLSKAGTSKHKLDSTEHEGATALFGVVEAIKTSNPAVLVSENVTEGFGSPIYQLLTMELTRLGYVVHHRIMMGHETPTLENRNRYWLVALSEGISEGFDWGNFELSSPYVTMNDVKEANIPEDMWCDNQYLKDKAITDKAAGKGFSRQLLTGEETKCGTIGRHYAKKRSTEPFFVRDDGKERLITKIEHCRVKLIPEKLVDGVCSTIAHQILGQSVDFIQALMVGMAVHTHLKNNV